MSGQNLDHLHTIPIQSGLVHIKTGLSIFGPVFLSIKPVWMGIVWRWSIKVKGNYIHSIAHFFYSFCVWSLEEVSQLLFSSFARHCIVTPGHWNITQIECYVSVGGFTHLMGNFPCSILHDPKKHKQQLLNTA